MSKVEFKTDFQVLRLINIVFCIPIIFFIIINIVFIIKQSFNYSLIISFFSFCLFVIWLIVVRIFYKTDGTVKKTIVLISQREENQREIDELQSIIQNNKREINYLKNEFDEFKSRERSNFRSVEERLKDEISKVSSEYGIEYKETLQKIFSSYIDDMLKKTFVSSASIDGLTFYLKNKLLSLGYRTAFDIFYATDIHEVYGIDHKTAVNLYSWSKSIARKFEKNKPTSLTDAQKLSLREKYLNKKTELQERIEQLENDTEQRIEEKRIKLNNQIKEIKKQNEVYQDDFSIIVNKNNSTKQLIDEFQKLTFTKFFVNSISSNFELTGNKARILGLVLIGFLSISQFVASFSSLFFSISREFSINEISSSPTILLLPSFTLTLTSTETPTLTETFTLTPSFTITFTETATQTATTTGTNTLTPTVTQTRTITPRPLFTIRPTDTRWPTATEGPTSPPIYGGGGDGGGGDDGGSGSNCDPSYPNVCIPSPPPDLNCDDIYYTDFIVVGDDPHGFDGDNDGIGCET
mgnify:CR=1 FL=1